MRKCLYFILILILLMPNISVFAAIPYMSLGYVPFPSFGHWRLDEDGTRFGTFFMQTVFKPASPMPVIGNPLFVDGVSVPGLEAPMDLFIDAYDYIYVVDMSQNRAVKITAQGELIREFGDSEGPGRLRSPEGIFVRRDTGEVYISDTGNFRVAVFSNEGEFLREITRPYDPRIGDTLFRPERIGVDSRGFYLLMLKGENRGLMLLNPNGEFAGFFGANVSQPNIFDRIRARVYTFSQRLATQRVQDSISDLYIDNNGFIYTATATASTEQIKKFNVGSLNLFRGRNMDINPLLRLQDGWTEGIRTSFNSVTVDRNGNVFALDAGSGRVFMFDQFGEPVLSFGARMMDRNNITVGRFGEPTAIRVNSQGTLFVTDRTYRGIIVFTPTPKAQMIIELNRLFIDGRYADAVPLAREILRENVFFFNANMVIAHYHFQNQRWEEARHYFRIALNTQEYSEAFWEYRLVFIQRNFVYAAMALPVIVFASGIKNVVKRKRKAARDSQ